MGIIQKRGYINRVKCAMIPTLTAYAVIQFLEKYFSDLVNLEFTADMEDILDSISRAEIKSTEFLNDFYNGKNQTTGLKNLLENDFDKNFSRTIMTLKNGTSNEILVKIGRYGTYLQQDEKSANLYDDYIPSELNFNNAIELLKKKKKEAKHSYVHPDTNQPIFLKDGRFGPYIQCEKKMKSLPPNMTLNEVTEKIGLDLLALPFKIGIHPDSKDKITKDIGRYGPYLRCGKKSSSLPKEDNIFDISLDRAIEILSQAKNKNATSVIKVLGKMPDSEENIELKDGRYGPYVTNGKINATIPKGENTDSLKLERAIELILEKKAKGPSKRFKRKK